ncbi:MAG: DUF1801 domain-containing protein [Bernardetiaceae bacterium]
MKTSITAFLLQLPPDKQRLVHLLHTEIQCYIPDIQSSIKWGIPFYSLQHPLCYLNPRPEHLIVGFYYGAQMPNRAGALTGTGSQVRHWCISWDTETPDVALLHELLEEALDYK